MPNNSGFTNHYYVRNSTSTILPIRFYLLQQITSAIYSRKSTISNFDYLCHRSQILHYIFFGYFLRDWFGIVETSSEAVRRRTSNHVKLFALFTPQPSQKVIKDHKIHRVKELDFMYIKRAEHLSFAIVISLSLMISSRRFPIWQWRRLSSTQLLAGDFRQRALHLTEESLTTGHHFLQAKGRVRIFHFQPFKVVRL